jgi:hypothetical protein
VVDARKAVICSITNEENRGERIDVFSLFHAVMHILAEALVN